MYRRNSLRAWLFVMIAMAALGVCARRGNTEPQPRSLYVTQRFATDGASIILSATATPSFPQFQQMADNTDFNRYTLTWWAGDGARATKTMQLDGSGYYTAAIALAAGVRAHFLVSAVSKNGDVLTEHVAASGAKIQSGGASYSFTTTSAPQSDPGLPPDLDMLVLHANIDAANLDFVMDLKESPRVVSNTNIMIRSYVFSVEAQIPAPGGETITTRRFLVYTPAARGIAALRANGVKAVDELTSECRLTDIPQLAMGAKVSTSEGVSCSTIGNTVKGRIRLDALGAGADEFTLRAMSGFYPEPATGIFVQLDITPYIRVWMRSHEADAATK